MKKIDFSKKFYARRNGKVVACKFEHLFVWFKASLLTAPFFLEQRKSEYVSYRLQLANGDIETGYYQCMPAEVYETIEECIAQTNPIRERVFFVERFIDRLPFTPQTKIVSSPMGDYLKWYAWRWDGFKAVFENISDDGACQSSLWYDAVKGEFVFKTKKYYSTEEECKKANHIDVIDF